jgi:ubiquinone/menaquinone biosynthesis C-methylase UbiE
MKNLDAFQIRDYVRERYGAIAEQDDASARSGSGCGDSASGGCCSASAPAKPSAGCGAEATYSETLGYSAAEVASVPAGADLGLGCGNPIALASIKSGETVLDLGSGAGFDCLLAARQLNGTGRVIGVDMTPPMISKGRRNAAQAGFTNVEFRLGEIEHLPVADATVDLIISNCVINLSPEKDQVFRDAFRVLKPGGRLAISDVVATKPVPPALREKLQAIGACVAGAALISDLKAMLQDAGFGRIEIQPRNSSHQTIAQWTEDAGVADFVVSAYLTAYKS